MEAARTAGQRAGLTRERVLAAAHALLEERGAEAVTMRAVADRLGVRPNALYSHIASKDALIEALLEEALAAVETPAAGRDARAAIQDVLLATHRALLAHPDLIPLYLARRGEKTPQAPRLREALRSHLHDAGVSGHRAEQALHVLLVYTIGAAAFASPSATGRTFETGLRWLMDGIAGHAPAQIPSLWR
jgi:AcrR family transcriptional regulator